MYYVYGFGSQPKALLQYLHIILTAMATKYSD
jgi:hypothetical protein